MTAPTPTGRWYWFACRTCPWAGIRYRNAKRCPKCRGNLRRGRPATAKEN